MSLMRAISRGNPGAPSSAPDTASGTSRAPPDATSAPKYGRVLPYKAGLGNLGQRAVFERVGSLPKGGASLHLAKRTARQHGENTLSRARHFSRVTPPTIPSCHLPASMFIRSQNVPHSHSMCMCVCVWDEAGHRTRDLCSLLTIPNY